MSQDINFSQILPRLKKLSQLVMKHLTFIIIVGILLVYVYVVARISSLTSAEPSPETEAAALAETNIPKIDKKAVEQIQSLEENSTELQSIFNEARTNPFLE